MSDELSLTDAVKLIAIRRTSLTEAVKDSAEDTVGDSALEDGAFEDETLEDGVLEDEISECGTLEGEYLEDGASEGAADDAPAPSGADAERNSADEVASEFSGEDEAVASDAGEEPTPAAAVSLPDAAPAPPPRLQQPLSHAPRVPAGSGLPYSSAARSWPGSCSWRSC